MTVSARMAGALRIGELTHAVDWPIGYDDLRPHYEAVERGLGIAGECGPFAPEPYTCRCRRIASSSRRRTA